MDSTGEPTGGQKNCNYLVRLPPGWVCTVRWVGFFFMPDGLGTSPGHYCEASHPCGDGDKAQGGVERVA